MYIINRLVFIMDTVFSMMYKLILCVSNFSVSILLPTLNTVIYLPAMVTYLVNMVSCVCSLSKYKYSPQGKIAISIFGN